MALNSEGAARPEEFWDPKDVRPVKPYAGDGLRRKFEVPHSDGSFSVSILVTNPPEQSNAADTFSA